MATGQPDLQFHLDRVAAVSLLAACHSRGLSSTRSQRREDEYEFCSQAAVSLRFAIEPRLRALEIHSRDCNAAVRSGSAVEVDAGLAIVVEAVLTRRILDVRVGVLAAGVRREIDMTVAVVVDSIAAERGGEIHAGHLADDEVAEFVRRRLIATVHDAL